jgi:nitroimidazol reductase NimA-like FMN-containing flavoprotein (pyridoxamine 5'-phosphate oxidase superfamily)
MASMSDLGPTASTTVRYAERARYDRETVHAVLDAGLVAHVGFVVEGDPFVIPMVYARVGDDLLLHGSPATRMFRTLRPAPRICVTITLVDGLVLARSAFHHSANYRSAVVVGHPEDVEDLAERAAALDAITERLAPGRLEHLRPMTEKELRGTRVVRLPITEASAKVRTGPPIDEEEDYELPIWAGVLPLSTAVGALVPDERNPADVVAPEHVARLEGLVLRGAGALPG